MVREPLLKNNSVTSRILNYLKEHPKSTCAEMEQDLNLSINQVRNKVCTLHNGTPKFGRRVYISGWTRDVLGTRTYLRAQYSLGDSKDAKNQNLFPPLSLQKGIARDMRYVYLLFLIWLRLTK